jgi:glycerol-3-phosphate acyltransferase PlsY
VTIHPLFKIMLVIASYMLGSVPFGLILSHAIAGVDVRDIGSGNIGATNVVRAAGKVTGVLTFLLDTLKSVIPLVIAIALLGVESSTSMVYWVTAVGLAAFYGHLFPIWLGFKGGKGVATGLGVFLVLTPWAGVVAFFTFVIIYAITRIASIGSIIAAVVCAAGVFITVGVRSPIAWSAAMIAASIIVRHRTNIIRLMVWRARRCRERRRSRWRRRR